MFKYLKMGITARVTSTNLKHKVYITVLKFALISYLTILDFIFVTSFSFVKISSLRGRPGITGGGGKDRKTLVRKFLGIFQINLNVTSLISKLI